jgi:glycolate oxidase FAD binding subunit
MPTTPVEIENEFRAILAPESIRAATSAVAICGLQPRLVLEPSNEIELAGALRLADDAKLAVILRGGSTKLDWGNPPQRADLIISTARLNKIIEHVWADLTVSVEAGCPIQKLQSALAEHGQRLAIDPLWPENATIGGALSTNDSGSLRLRFGALRDLIIGVTIALPDGTLASSGGKVVKNVAGYDLPKLVTGAFGTLGVITRAIFRLHPLPHHTKTLSVSAENLETAQRLLLAVQDSQLAHSALQTRAGLNAQPIVDILFEGTEEGIAAQEAQFRNLAHPSNVSEPPDTIWNASRELWNSATSAAIAKITALPASIARCIQAVERIAAGHNAQWNLVMQAFGIGSLRLDTSPANLHAILSELRGELERDGASLTVLHHPAAMPHLDAWGNPGDALPLMRAIKAQLDPKCTLNPGRFVGSI